MPVSKADAEDARKSAEDDIRENGARATLYFDGGIPDETGARTSVPRSVKLWAVLGSYNLHLVDGQRVQQGDVRVMIADRALASLTLAGLPSVFDEKASSGFWLYLPANPEQWPVAADPPAAGDRRLAVVALESTTSLGGYAVLRVIQCRG